MGVHGSTSSRGTGWLYAAGWLPYYSFLALIFFSSDVGRPWHALWSALLQLLPDALLGLLVLRLCRALPWPGRLRFGFFALHLGSALLFAGLSLVARLAAFTVHRWVVEGVLEPATIPPQILAWQLLLSALIYCTLAGIAYVLQAMGRLRSAEALRTEAELRALRAQLNPHFLFNTLHSLLALVRHDAGAAEEALEQFGDLLRYTLRVNAETLEEVPLSEEWAFVDTYLALERLRLGARLRLERTATPAALASVVPVFCLQPLVENAIRHAIAPRAGGGRLVIVAEVIDEETLQLRVRDDGPGTGAPEQNGRGLGLQLVARRLAMLYGARGRLEAGPRPEGGFQVTVTLPARETLRLDPAAEDAR